MKMRKRTKRRVAVNMPLSSHLLVMPGSSVFVHDGFLNPAIREAEVNLIRRADSCPC